MKKYLLPFLIVFFLGAGLIYFSEKNWVDNPTFPTNKTRISSEKSHDPLLEKLSEELLNHGWIKPGDSLVISVLDSSANSLAISHFEKGKKIPENSWIYYGNDFAVVDTVNNREFMMGPTVTKEDRKRLQQYNPADP